VFENKVLRGIFGSGMDKVTRGWRKLHNDELHNLYSSTNIIRMINSRHIVHMVKMRNVYKVLVGWKA
jgi:hypothetical protein